MISLWTEDTLPQLPSDWQGAYIQSRYAAYGTKAHFAPFYADEQNNILSILDGNAILSGSNIDVEEWAAFISMQPDIVTFSAALPVTKHITSILQRDILEKKVMCLQKVLLPPDIHLVTPSPREMYPLLSHVFGDTMPPFENWYVDTSHRIRHGICKTAGVECDGVLVCTAMTVAESADAAIIGAVATAPTHRRQGMANACLRGLVTAIYAENKQKSIMISPKNSGAEKLYSQIGFTVCGEIGKIDI